jgi:hypothetical protein
MKKILLTGVLLLTCGCTGMENTDRGMATGGVLGGILGLGVGAITHHPLAGAAIGAGAGALAGGAIGNHEDRAEAHAVAQAAAAHPPLSLEDVARMSQQRISGWLKQQGVSDYVIAEMQSRTPAIYGPRYAREVVVVEPAPVAVGVGFVGRVR